jgi:hypothetical protein
VLKNVEGRDECDGEKVDLNRRFDNLFILILGLCQHCRSNFKVGPVDSVHLARDCAGGSK